MTQPYNAEEAHVQREFAVVLTGYHSRCRTTVLKAVREAVPGSLAESIALLQAATLDPAGRVVVERVGYPAVETIIANWEATGAIVRAVEIPPLNWREGSTEWEAQYETAILAALEIPPLPRYSPDRLVYRALFQPSFHAYTCVTIHTFGNAGTVEITVARENFHRSLWPKLGQPGPSNATAHREQEMIPTSVLQRFLTILADLNPAVSLNREAVIGLDGITIQGEIVSGPTIHRFRIWSPSPEHHPAHYHLSIATLDLAATCLPAARSQQGLQDVRRYLR
jgi:hypothetical protein